MAKVTKSTGNTGDDRLSGSVDQLVKAIRGVFLEVAHTVSEPILTEMGNMEARVDARFNKQDEKMVQMETRLNTHIDTTNINMQAQFAEQQKIIGQLESRLDGHIKDSNKNLQEQFAAQESKIRQMLRRA